jgi:hypothetical protein
MLVIRFGTETRGAMCSSCLHSAFWRNTLVTLFFGWWGIISFFVTLFILPLNVANYIQALINFPEPGLMPDEPEESFFIDSEEEPARPHRSRRLRDDQVDDVEVVS